jgi:hypothetical protein
MTQDDVARTPHEFALRALKAADNDRERAQELLLEWMNADVGIMAMFTSGYAAQAARTEISKAAAQLRAELWRTAGAGAPDPIKPRASEKTAKTVEKIGHFEAFGRSILFGYILPTGKPLGVATKADLENAMALHAAHARGNLRSRKFLQRVAERLDATQQVADVWKDVDLLALMRRVGLEK